MVNKRVSPFMRTPKTTRIEALKATTEGIGIVEEVSIIITTQIYENINQDRIINTEDQIMEREVMQSELIMKEMEMVKGLEITEEMEIIGDTKGKLEMGENMDVDINKMKLENNINTKSLTKSNDKLNNISINKINKTNKKNQKIFEKNNKNKPNHRNNYR